MRLNVEGGMDSKRVLTMDEQLVVNYFLRGMSPEEAAKQAQLPAREGKVILSRPVVRDHVYREFSRLGLQWQRLARDAKRCLSWVINKDPRAGKVTPSNQVTACKIVLNTMVDMGSMKELQDDEKGTSTEQAARDILGRTGEDEMVVN